MFWGSLLRPVTSIGQHVQREEWVSQHLWGGGCSLAWLLVRQVEVYLSLRRQSTALGRKAYVSCRAGIQLCVERPFCDANLCVYSTNQEVLNSFTDTQEWVGQLTSSAALANHRFVDPGALCTLGTVSAAGQCSGISAPRAGHHATPLSAFPISRGSTRAQPPLLWHWPARHASQVSFHQQKGRGKGTAAQILCQQSPWHKAKASSYGAGNTGHSHAGEATAGAISGLHTLCCHWPCGCPCA